VECECWWGPRRAVCFKRRRDAQRLDRERTFFCGWEVYHVKGSPVDPNRLYASQSSGWFGQVIQRSDDGGATWAPVGNKLRMKECRERTSGTTARRTPGSSAGVAPGAFVDRRGDGFRRG